MTLATHVYIISIIFLHYYLPTLFICFFKFGPKCNGKNGRTKINKQITLGGVSMRIQSIFAAIRKRPTHAHTPNKEVKQKKKST